MLIHRGNLRNVLEMWILESLDMANPIEELEKQYYFHKTLRNNYEDVYKGHLSWVIDEGKSTK